MVCERQMGNGNASLLMLAAARPDIENSPAECSSARRAQYTPCNISVRLDGGWTRRRTSFRLPNQDRVSPFGPGAASNAVRRYGAGRMLSLTSKTFSGLLGSDPSHCGTIMIDMHFITAQDDIFPSVPHRPSILRPAPSSPAFPQGRHTSTCSLLTHLSAP